MVSVIFRFRPMLFNRIYFLKHIDQRDCWCCLFHSVYCIHPFLQNRLDPQIIPAGLKEITTIELFTQNYLKYDHISFTIWKRIKFYVYPPGARLSRPSHLFTQRLYFFCKIWDTIHKFFGEKICGSDPKIYKYQNLKDVKKCVCTS